MNNIVISYTAATCRNRDSFRDRPKLGEFNVLSTILYIIIIPNTRPIVCARAWRLETSAGKKPVGRETVGRSKARVFRFSRTDSARLMNTAVSSFCPSCVGYVSDITRHRECRPPTSSLIMTAELSRDTNSHANNVLLLLLYFFRYDNNSAGKKVVFCWTTTKRRKRLGDVQAHFISIGFFLVSAEICRIARTRERERESSATIRDVARSLVIAIAYIWRVTGATRRYDNKIRFRVYRVACTKYKYFATTRTCQNIFWSNAINATARTRSVEIDRATADSLMVLGSSPRQHLSNCRVASAMDLHRSRR